MKSFKEKNQEARNICKELIRKTNKQIFKANSAICKINGKKPTIENFKELGLKIPRNMRDYNEIK